MLHNSFCRFALLLHFTVSALSPHGEYITYTYCDLASDELLWSIKSVASFVHLALVLVDFLKTGSTNVICGGAKCDTKMYRFGNGLAQQCCSLSRMWREEDTKALLC